MRNLFIIACLILITGCATPSEVHKEYYKTGEVKSVTEKYDNSTYYSVRVYGIDIGVDVETKIPRVRVGIIKFEAARVSKGQCFDSFFSFEDISLIKGQGNGKQQFKINDVEKQTGQSNENYFIPAPSVNPYFQAINSNAIEVSK